MAWRSSERIVDTLTILQLFGGPGKFPHPALRGDFYGLLILGRPITWIVPLPGASDPPRRDSNIPHEYCMGSTACLAFSR